MSSHYYSSDNEGNNTIHPAYPCAPPQPSFPSIHPFLFEQGFTFLYSEKNKDYYQKDGKKYIYCEPCGHFRPDDYKYKDLIHFKTLDEAKERILAYLNENGL